MPFISSASSLSYNSQYLDLLMRAVCRIPSHAREAQYCWEPGREPRPETLRLLWFSHKFACTGAAGHGGMRQWLFHCKMDEET